MKVVKRTKKKTKKNNRLLFCVLLAQGELCVEGTDFNKRKFVYKFLFYFKYWQCSATMDERRL
jgi:hypothetical protein